MWRLIVSSLVLASCASGEAERPEQACQVDADCAPLVCDLGTGKCVSSQNNAQNSNLPDVAFPDVGEENNTSNNVEPDMNLDMDVACDPVCADNEVCQSGSCVSACMPSCVAPQICGAEGCVYPQCQAVGARCEPLGEQPDGFVCLVETGTSIGTCFETCESPLSASTCPNGSYCLGVGQGDTSVCFESECGSNADCGAETCLIFDNGFGSCFGGGTLPEGTACDTRNNACAQGMFCVSNQATGTAGTCRRLCDPFAGGECGAQQACGPFLTPRQAYCTTEITTVPRQAYQQCSPADAYCGDRTLCVEFEPNISACLPYCRPGESDCENLVPNETLLCNPYFAPQGLGICLLACDPSVANDCGDGQVCVAQGPETGLCRISCTSGNEVQDCCNGVSPCTRECVNNLCE